MFFIESQRLRLIPLTHQLLQLFTNRAALELALGLMPYTIQVSPFYHTEIEDALQNFWLPKTLEHPERYMWYTSWEVVLKSGNISIGGIGFAGYPDENGETEVGYMICELQQKKGYATEALQTITKWAFEQEDVKAIIAQIPVGNLPSQRTLLKNGFEKIEEKDRLLKYKLNRS